MLKLLYRSYMSVCTLTATNLTHTSTLPSYLHMLDSSLVGNIHLPAVASVHSFVGGGCRICCTDSVQWAVGEVSTMDDTT